MRPHFGQVKRIPFERIRLLLCHDLDLQRPTRILTAFDCLIKVTLVALAILADDFCSLVIHPVLDALIGFEMELAPHAFTRSVDQRIGMTAIAIQMSVGSGQAAIRKENRDLMQ